MKLRAWIIALVAILSLGALPLFAGTRIVFRWVLTGIPMPTIKKILIVGLTDNYLVRQEFEDKMEELLAKSGVTGIESHMVFPPRNKLLEGELRQRIRESTLDAVLVVRPKEVRKESQEVVSGGSTSLRRAITLSGPTGIWRTGTSTPPRPTSKKTQSSAPDATSTIRKTRNSFGAAKATRCWRNVSRKWARAMPSRSTTS
jgi:hypothetical protein